MENKTPETSTTEYKPSRVLTATFEWMSAAIVALVLIVLVFAVFLRTVNVDGDSMYPNLHNGDRLVISNFAYSPEYGDIVIVLREHNTPLIKRVIGLPGDVIQIDNDKGVVIRNGQELAEPYIQSGITKQSQYATGLSTPLTVPEGRVYVLGDNRGNSTDSRREGCYSMEQVVGRVLFRLTPEMGKVE